MSQATEVVSESVEEVRFSFMTDEEVRKHSVVKITNPILLDTLNNPVPGGLYDPAMGPLEEFKSICKTCGQNQFTCHGHCGHIDLVTPVFNPLLFNLVFRVLQRTCFYCQHFRANRGEVEKCVAQLRCIAKGDVIEAKRLESFPPSELANPADSDGSHVSCSTIHSDAQTHSSKQNQGWTSVQLTEALSILNRFLHPRFSKCKNCEAKNPKITKPTFGWIHKRDLSAEDTRANIIRGKVDSSNSGDDDEVVNAVDRDPVTSRSSKKKYLTKPLRPSEVKEIIRALWENEASLCSFICDIQQQSVNISGNNAGYSMFFLEAILVPPIKFRPATRGGGDSAVMENPQTVLLNKVLEANIALGNAYINASERSKIVNRTMDLQQSVNVLYDTKTAMGQSQKELSGICQLLEKKEGIFRQKMMGKRVNYACRSVISPDPYLAVNEIGVPPYFALRLTYVERLNHWNAANLRNAIVNGPEIHPGATKYVDKVSTTLLKPRDKKSRVAIARKLTSSRGAITQNGRTGDNDFEGKVVHRHLRDGDIVLVNRQPTLHKPSIMAHVVRVLKGEKTLRMHYANCSSYNADFDGDEMNVHLPQDEISRAEGYNIVNANQQYIVPTKGDTVRGLIQDHIVSGVILMLKDTFLTSDQFNQLLYSSGVFDNVSDSSFGKPGKKVFVLRRKDHLHAVLPAILRPRPLWTGKQVISALLNHLTRGCPPFTVEKDGKIPASYFGSKDGKSKGGKGSKSEENDEHNLLIRKNELVHGVIDKAQYGKYGLVHTVQELYGADTAGLLLSALSRVFTTFLQTHGFTCGMDDLMILPHYDVKRKKELEDEDVGEEVLSNFFKFKSGATDPRKLQFAIEKAIHKGGQSAISLMDMKMKNRLHEKTSDVNKDLLLKGLLKPFPKNCISLMTISGAKGSTVNFQQISSCLGQQELEGKRVPRMVSGKTLPCFPPWDFSSRGGGFISDRFLTGLRPQEYYFHCMAGREGLVDTAVKTSRSGYLQRCLVKNLESLKVCYDYTVRDADGSIIQFTYGDDGVDVHQTSFITQFKALALNEEIIDRKFHNRLEFNHYITELPEGLERKAKRFLKGLKQQKTSLGLAKPEDLMKLVTQKYISSLAHSGEPVGVIAAQSIGEPSTQMTLNTFHHAGRGEMNVTLGIPRLQEILMTAANEIKTPIMTCPMLEGKSKDDAEKLVRKMKKFTVADIIETMEVSVVPVSVYESEIVRIYKLKIKLRESQSCSLEDYEETMESSFLRALEDAIQSHIILLSKISGIKNVVSSFKSASENEDDEDSSKEKHRDEGEDDEDEDHDDVVDDLGSDAQKRKAQATDEKDYEDGAREDEHGEGEASEVDQGGDVDGDVSDDGETVGRSDVEDETPENNKSDKKNKPKEKKKKKEKAKKDTDRAIFVSARGWDFEVHLRFTDEPHVLLDQIAQKAAKKVHLKNSGKIDMCQAVKAGKNDQVLWEHEDESYNKKSGEISEHWALKTAGVDLKSLWEMQDDLDINRIYSNNIHAILETYGVEAARETILREVKHVFQSYGVEIDSRHLSLITDFMTHTGGYRPMSRHGGIAGSVSPFLKMSFETASKFIVESAAHGLSDNLETPSSRICLGLPVKMGTGCFDIMQKIDI